MASSTSPRPPSAPAPPAWIREPSLSKGEVVQSILDLARREEADAIVMGSHGRGGIARIVLGSKTEGVLRRAPVPVLVAPTAAAAARAS
ncbi:universal stress protein [bacterium]|nr:MAG: universal stress protein [bacterium]